ncbi:MAG: M23 family metallopeptidase [Crocinitomicaceae bacterium]
MGFWKSFIEKSRKKLKYSVSNPTNFEEVWSFTSTRVQIFSLLFVLILGLGFGMSYLISALGGPGAGTNDKTIEREQLEEQYEAIEQLTARLEAQQKYIGALRRIMNGEVPVDSNLDSLAKETDADYGDIQAKQSPSEVAISNKVKEDMRTGKSTGAPIPYFTSPVIGIVSDGFKKGEHPGIDVVTEKNESIKSCLSGTVIYAGYSRKDGYMAIVDHGNGYTSIYKHARKTLKKTGDRVQLGDPIAIVGNTGTNTTGPHLHFELWYQQMPVNPEDYITFTR